MQKIAVHVWLISALLVLAPLSGLHAAKLYKWVDDEGQTHYSQLPPERGQATEMPMPRTGVRNEISDEEAEEQAAQADDPVAQLREIRQQNCQIARQNLQVYQTSDRVELPDGSELEMDEANRAAKIAEAQEMIRQFCD